jgi:endonuclease YncB( thermonuclease family)
VDTPEKHRNGYAAGRVADQAAYFGGISEGATTEFGQRSAAVTIGLLERYPFSLFTRWERVYDSDRIYGFIRFTEGPQSGRYLSEILVENGLARIHTKGVETPDGRSRRAFERHLRSLEDSARRERLGAWGAQPR